MDQACPAESAIFPSGRAAVAQVLEGARLPAGAAVALPEWVSDCLARTVRRTGERRPAPFAAAEQCSAVVVYETWGWPLANAALERLRTLGQGRLVIVDRVDSADFFCRPIPLRDLGSGAVDVTSLSKLLGLPGGGLARGSVGCEAFVPSGGSTALRQLQARSLPTHLHNGHAELFKLSRAVVHPGALAWAGEHCLWAAVEAERQARQTNLQVLLRTSLAAGWPEWMLDAIAYGAGPAWAPLLRGAEPADWQAAMTRLHRELNLAASVRMFNWSGDLFQPSYAPALAVPIHSGVREMEAVVKALDT